MPLQQFFGALWLQRRHWAKLWVGLHTCVRRQFSLACAPKFRVVLLLSRLSFTCGHWSVFVIWLGRIDLLRLSRQRSPIRVWRFEQLISTPFRVVTQKTKETTVVGRDRRTTHTKIKCLTLHYKHAVLNSFIQSYSSEKSSEVLKVLSIKYCILLLNADFI